MRIKSKQTAQHYTGYWPLLAVFVVFVAVVGWCEVLVFYVTLWTRCQWPVVGNQSAEYVNIVLLSDTHLLGEKRGHWFDKLRREWQMYMSYKAALSIFRPEYVFMLGDILDEGQIASDHQFQNYVETFKQLFATNEETKRVVVVGNHDIGFHDRVLYFDPYLRGRFEHSFNTSLVDMIVIKGSHFITINSMALEGDGCDLCTRAVTKIRVLARQLHECQQSKTCVRPVLLLHFPLFRESDEICNEIDSDTSDARKIKFKPKIDCVSLESTRFLLEQLKPRLVFTGHTHHGCLVKHTKEAIEEWTLASFSWRNIATPSFLLAKISTKDYIVNKCLLPNEIAVISTYAITCVTILIYFFLRYKNSA